MLFRLLNIIWSEKWSISRNCTSHKPEDYIEYAQRIQAATEHL